jgi:hypothetical protein
LGAAAFGLSFCSDGRRNASSEYGAMEVQTGPDELVITTHQHFRGYAVRSWIVALPRSNGTALALTLRERPTLKNLETNHGFSYGDETS